MLGRKSKKMDEDHIDTVIHYLFKRLNNPSYDYEYFADILELCINIIVFISNRKRKTKKIKRIIKELGSVFMTLRFECKQVLIRKKDFLTESEISFYRAMLKVFYKELAIEEIENLTKPYIVK